MKKTQEVPESQANKKTSDFPKSDKRAGFMIVVILIAISAWEITTKANLWPTSMTKTTRELLLIVPVMFFTMLYLYSIEDHTALWGAEKAEKIGNLFKKGE